MSGRQTIHQRPRVRQSSAACLAGAAQGPHDGALTVRFRLDWILAISGPLLTVGVLFLWSWRTQHEVNAN